MNAARERLFSLGLWFRLLTALAVALAFAPWLAAQPAHASDQLALLLPDGARVDSPSVTIWLDAAAEEGLHLTPIADTDFLQHPGNYPGVILPDGLHLEASDALVQALDSYVQSGGKLMLVFDAGTRNVHGMYTPQKSRFSMLAGVDYALYESLRDGTMRRSPVLGTEATIVDLLQIPPGKAVRFTGDASQNCGSGYPKGSPVLYTLDTYTYGDIPYPSFVTRGIYRGETLLCSASGLAAGFEAHGRGGVLFVNLPLGYLALRTDALLLHGFLHYFAARAGVPMLGAVPDGVGGLVLNWHLDSNAADQSMDTVEKIGFFQQGPFSFHITAGPDRDRAGDHLGLDIPHNQRMQQWIHRLVQEGNTIGDHGGWIHNYFGLNVNENDQSFRLYLELNTQALEAVVGKPIVEYSAPVGNHPKWVTAWLEEHGFVAYYFTGNTGMAPTRTYRDGSRSDHSIWSFPITNCGKAASLEDLHFAGVPDPQVSAWLLALTDFVSRQRVSRLIYVHPPGAQFYPNALRVWLEHTATLSRDGSFRWYTMTALASFLSARQQVQWSTDQDGNGSWSIQASHPRTLAHQTWLLPRDRFAKPRIAEGSATISEDAERWIVTAKDGAQLRFSARPLGKK